MVGFIPPYHKPHERCPLNALQYIFMNHFILFFVFFSSLITSYPISFQRQYPENENAPQSPILYGAFFDILQTDHHSSTTDAATNTFAVRRSFAFATICTSRIWQVHSLGRSAATIIWGGGMAIRRHPYDRTCHKVKHSLLPFSPFKEQSTNPITLMILITINKTNNKPNAIIHSHFFFFLRSS